MSTLQEITANKPQQIKTKTILAGKENGRPTKDKVNCRFTWQLENKKRQPVLYLYEHITEADLLLTASLFETKKMVLCISMPEWLNYPESVQKELKNFEKIWKHPYQKSQVFLRKVLAAAKDGKNIIMAVSDGLREPGQMLRGKTAMIKLFRMLQMPVCAVTFAGTYRRKPFWGTQSEEATLSGIVKPIFAQDELQNLPMHQLENLLEQAFVKERKEFYTARKRCQGLESYLYHCPVCKENGLIGTAADGIFCGKCGKIFQLGADGAIYKFHGDKFMDSVYEWMDLQSRQMMRLVLKSELSRKMNAEVYEFQADKQMLLRLGKGEIHIDLSGITLTVGQIKEYHRGGALPSVGVYPFFKDGRTCVTLPFGKKVYYVMLGNAGEAGMIKDAVETLYHMAEEMN
ncbi:MAG: hypothetical protein E7269_07020 [Lachnospiraceae bacterium]|nr:hypothetical protein [Lachnospiraceae bacterium]